MKKMTAKINFLFLAILALTLQSCIFVAGAAAGAAAIAIVYDHRNVESILLDQKIAREVLHRIQDDPDLRENTHINVTSFGQVILLTGESPNVDLRKRAEDLARSVRGVTRVYNAISIQGPTSSLSHASDAWITAKIKTEMLATKGLKSASIKVVTENGTVYLMGLVTPAQGATIVNIAQHTAGVQKVVKIFQYNEAANEGAQSETPPVVTAGVEDNKITPVNSGNTASTVTAQAQGRDDMQPLIAGGN